MAATDEALKYLHVPADRAGEPVVREAAELLLVSLGRFSRLLPPAERPSRPADLLPLMARSNVLDSLRIERGLPLTLVFFPSVHPAYYEGAARLGDAPWRIAYTDGGEVPDSPVLDRLLDECIRLAEAMHEKTPFAESPFDGGRTVLLHEEGCFQAVTALYGEAGSRFILANGGILYHSRAPQSERSKREVLTRWAASSVTAGVLGHRYIAGPDLNMDEDDMAWLNAAAGESGRVRGRRLHPPVTGLAAEAGGYPLAGWELTGRTLVATLEEVLGHPAARRYGVETARPIRVVILGFGDVGGSVARLLMEESRFAYRIVGVADALSALHHPDGLDVTELLALRAARRSLLDYEGEVLGLWAAEPGAASLRRGWRGRDVREVLLADCDVIVPAAVPDVIDEEMAGRIRARIIAEGADGAVAPRVEDRLHALGVLYLPGQALNWGGVKGSTLEVLLREGTKRTAPMAAIEKRVRQALEPFGGSVDLAWALDLLRSGLVRPPLDVIERRALAIAQLEDLARINARWLMDELEETRNARPPLAILRDLARSVRMFKARLLSLVERGLGPEFFGPETSLRRLQCLLADRLKDLLAGPADEGALTALQVVEQRQLLERVQKEVLHGISPVLAAQTAALDLARQRVMDPEGYTPESMHGDLATLCDLGAPVRAHEEILHRLQRVHPGPARAQFIQALAALLKDRKVTSGIRRNAALAMAKLGTAEPAHRSLLQQKLGDHDASVRAACRWALHQMAITPPGES